MKKISIDEIYNMINFNNFIVEQAIKINYLDEGVYINNYNEVSIGIENRTSGQLIYVTFFSYGSSECNNMSCILEQSVLFDIDRLNNIDNEILIKKEKQENALNEILKMD